MENEALLDAYEEHSQGNGFCLRWNSGPEGARRITGGTPLLLTQSDSRAVVCALELRCEQMSRRVGK